VRYTNLLNVIKCYNKSANIPSYTLHLIEILFVRSRYFRTSTFQQRDIIFIPVLVRKISFHMPRCKMSANTFRTQAQRKHIQYNVASAADTVCVDCACAKLQDAIAVTKIINTCLQMTLEPEEKQRRKRMCE